MAPYSQNSESTRGLWTQTASIDWCESNYELSYYVAEFWNTLSNFAFILPQVIQYFALARHKNIEFAYRSAFLSLALVGVGSFCFHMTLSKQMQMFDETSMILVSLHTFYLLYIIKYPRVDRRRLVIFLLCYGLNFFGLYVFLVNWPIFHHSAFGILVYASMAIGYRVKQIHGVHYKFWSVVILHHLAFAFWLFDKHYCETLTHFRDHHVSSFLKPAFQFHALWHLFMGLGTHTFVCGLIRLRAWTKYREEYVINYKWFGLFIYLEKLDSANSPMANMEEQRKQQRQLRELQRRELNLQLQTCPDSAEIKYRFTQPETNNQSNEIDLNQNEVRQSPCGGDAS